MSYLAKEHELKILISCVLPMSCIPLLIYHSNQYFIENKKKIRELERDYQKEINKKQRVLDDYKKSWATEALVKQIKGEITDELKQAFRDGKDMDEFEFDQAKFKKVCNILFYFYFT